MRLLPLKLHSLLLSFQRRSTTNQPSKLEEMTENSDFREHEESVFWCFFLQVFEYLVQICILVIVSITLCLRIYTYWFCHDWNNCISFCIFLFNKSLSSSSFVNYVNEHLELRVFYKMSPRLYFGIFSKIWNFQQETNFCRTVECRWHGACF